MWRNAVSYGRKPNSSSETQCVDLCYLIDKSGSMSGSYMNTAKESIRNFVEAMYEGDRGAIVGYDSVARLYQNFTSSKDSLRIALGAISASGGTNVENGLIRALDLFPSSEEQLASGIRNKRVIVLLCDGDVYYSEDTLNRAKNMGVKIYPILIGSTYGQAKLQKMAEETGGNFYYAATAQEIREAIFGVQEDTIGELDGEEMGMVVKFEEQSTLKKIILKLRGFDNEVYAEYFDYQSDPSKTDSDGDGYDDGDDPHRLVKDVRIVAIEDSEKFVEIFEGDIENTIKYYGGDQDWYSSKLAQDGACGTVAAANITAYMASREDSDYSKLYEYEDFSKDNFVSHMNDMYSYLKPFRIPFTETPLGIWPMSRFENKVEKFASDKGVSMSGVKDNSSFTKENVIDYIEEGLENDAPVAMLIGFNDDLKNIRVTQPNGFSWLQTTFSTHWVVITELKTDEIAGTSTAKVSTWGGYAYLDLDSFINGEKVYECVLYFE